MLLADQDRTTWHHDEIADGLRLLSRSMSDAALSGAAERYRLQALIATAHATAATAADTDWSAIVTHYEELERLTASPVVRLNHAVAVAEADGPARGLALLDGLDGLDDALAHSHSLPAVRAELLGRLGRHAEAVTAFDRALELVGTDAERAHLVARRTDAAQSAGSDRGDGPSTASGDDQPFERPAARYRAPGAADVDPVREDTS